jgi:hypothetical protein
MAKAKQTKTVKIKQIRKNGVKKSIARKKKK